jgi:hypothetical protein
MTSNKQQKTPSKEHMNGVLKDWMETVDQVGLGGRTGQEKILWSCRTATLPEVLSR